MTPRRAFETPGDAAAQASALTTEDAAALWHLEELFWAGGLDSARSTTAKDAVMIIPYPVGILQGDRTWQHLEQEKPWRSVEITERNAARRGSVAVLYYRVSAERADAPICEALCASTYVQDDGKWLRMSHQRTPIA